MYVHLREMVNDPGVRTPPRNVCKFDLLLRGEGVEMDASSQLVRQAKLQNRRHLFFPTGQAQRRKATGKSQIESGFVGKERLL